MKYNSAPIIEAIFDIRVAELVGVTIEDIDKLHSLVKKDYPDKKKQINFVGRIDFKESVQVTNKTESNIRGLIFSNQANTRKFQFRLDGFTYNMLKPYTEWSEFSNEALRLWTIFEQNLKPTNIVRIALRYINKIQLPLPTEFQDFIINMPPIPGCLPQSLNSFFMQIQVPCDNQGTNAIITETIEQPSDSLPFILDLDIYKNGVFKYDLEYLKAEFELLRKIKNETFEYCITDKTRQLFK